MEFPRGVYKEEIYPGLIEYRAYTHTGRLCSKSEIPADFATPATDDAFEAWLDILDPLVPKNLIEIFDALPASLPASGGLAA
jgi:hypothetical protein